MNYRDLQNISNLSQEILIEGANEEHNVLNRWPYTSPYLQESTELDEGAAGDVAARAQKLANQRKGQTPERKKIYQGLADKAAARERGPFMGGTVRKNMTSADRDASRESDAYHSSVFGERSKINQHGDSTYGPGGKPKGKKAERQKSRGVSAEGYDLYDIILSHLLDEGYAETLEQAQVIMVNMSEEWRESIVEGGIPNLNLPWNKKSSGTAQGDFESGGGLAKMKKSGMNRDEVITQGQRNIHNSPLTGTLSPTRFASNRSTDTGRKMNDYYKKAGVKFPEDSK